jgi:antitoxin Phd
MGSWPAQDAKARFSEMLETCLKEGPQVVTTRGAKAAVLVSMQDWQRLQHAAGPTLKALLLANHARGELSVPQRGGRRRHAPRKLI